MLSWGEYSDFNFGVEWEWFNRSRTQSPLFPTDLNFHSDFDFDFDFNFRHEPNTLEDLAISILIPIYSDPHSYSDFNHESNIP